MNTNRTDLMALEKSIKRSLKLVTGTMALAMAGYFLWFFAYHSQPLSPNTSAWGEFGDFIGGLLNPLVAYSAFYWLTRSVLLQKEELLETRKALEESARSAKPARYCSRRGSTDFGVHSIAELRSNRSPVFA